MSRIAKSRTKYQSFWEEALNRHRGQLQYYADYLTPCGCSKDIVQRVEVEVRETSVPDEFKFRFTLRHLLQHVIQHPRECAQTHTSCSDGIPVQERLVYFMRDILEYSKRDTSLLMGISDGRADELLSSARKRIDMIEGPSFFHMESSDSVYFRWRFRDLHLR